MQKNKHLLHVYVFNDISERQVISPSKVSDYFHAYQFIEFSNQFKCFIFKSNKAKYKWLIIAEERNIDEKEISLYLQTKE